MRKIETVMVYNLVNSKGTKLRLEAGIITEGLRDEYPIASNDNGNRWRFFGPQIPMPVRAGYWFNGFMEPIMLDWLKANGWHVHTRVKMPSGITTVYELPSELSKGNETHKYVLPDWAIHAGERALREAVKMLHAKGSRIDAASLYRYVHPSDMYDANLAISKMLAIDNET